MSEDIVHKIMAQKRSRNAVILVHNYQRGDVQDIGDFVGDSLGLSKQAAETDADVIVFCGVHFMAENAALLNASRTVLIPDENAGCPMANMIAARELRAAKEAHPDAVVVCYVNSTAAVKAESDICCTSANAVDVVRSIPADRPVLFVPDKSLGHYVARQLGREIILWEGYCPTHHRILAENILQRREDHPEAEVVVHPECTSDVIDLADHVASTSGILRYCHQSSSNEFIIGTEGGILHRLAKENPDKRFYHATRLADCPNMKLITLQKVLWSLEDMTHRVEVPGEIAEKARQPIERMLNL